MPANVLPLDSAIAILADFAAMLDANCGGPKPIRVPDPRFHAASSALFWGMVSIAFAGASAYQATPESASGARHLAYTEGVVTPRARMTAADRRAAEQQQEARAWGFRS